MHEFLDKTTERTDADKRFMQYMGKSIVMALRFGVLEMADFGTKLFASLWGMDVFAGIYTRPAAPNS